MSVYIDYTDKELLEYYIQLKIEYITEIDNKALKKDYYDESSWKKQNRLYVKLDEVRQEILERMGGRG